MSMAVQRNGLSSDKCFWVLIKSFQIAHRVNLLIFSIVLSMFIKTKVKTERATHYPTQLLSVEASLVQFLMHQR